MAAKLLNLLPSHGARERRERWQFDIRFSQCDGLSGLGDLSSNLGSVEGEVCVQLARHAKVAVSQCAAVAGGSASWEADAGVLSLVCTLKAHEGGARVDMYAVPQPCRSRTYGPRIPASGFCLPATGVLYTSACLGTTGGGFDPKPFKLTLLQQHAARPACSGRRTQVSHSAPAASIDGPAQPDAIMGCLWLGVHPVLLPRA